jgi:hypothetical protein
VYDTWISCHLIVGTHQKIIKKNMAKVTKEAFQQYLREVDALVASATAHQELGNTQASNQLFAKANHLQRAWENILSNSLQEERSSTLQDFVGITRMTAASRRQRVKKASTTTTTSTTAYEAHNRNKSHTVNATTPKKSASSSPSTSISPPWRGGGKFIATPSSLPPRSPPKQQHQPFFTSSTSPAYKSSRNRKASSVSTKVLDSNSRPTRVSQVPVHYHHHHPTAAAQDDDDKDDEDEDDDDDEDGRPLTKGLDALDTGKPIADQAWW